MTDQPNLIRFPWWFRWGFLVIVISHIHLVTAGHMRDADAVAQQRADRELVAIREAAYSEALSGSPKPEQRRIWPITMSDGSLIKISISAGDPDRIYADILDILSVRGFTRERLDQAIAQDTERAGAQRVQVLQ